MKNKGLNVDEVELTDAPIVSGLGIPPKFYNAVKQGFEWNKYNQTHYSADNPPPKMIQGYKFNIFYPDLQSNGTP